MNCHLCAVAEKFTGELALISPDCLHDLAPTPSSVIANEVKQSQKNDGGEIASLHSVPLAMTSVSPPTPQEQQKVENWLKVKVQRPLRDMERKQRQRELQIRQDYLQKAMESAIGEAQRTQMKLAAKVAGGDETYRVVRDNAQNKVRYLQERYKNKQSELEYLKIIRPGRVAYLGTALVHHAPVEVSNYPGMQNDPEVEAFAMQSVCDGLRMSARLGTGGCEQKTG